MTDPTAPLTSSEVETHDPRADLIRAAQQCADASAQLLLHHTEEGQSYPPVRFQGELVEQLAEALRTACEVEQDALDHVQRLPPRVHHAAFQRENSELGQLAAACSKYLGR